MTLYDSAFYTGQRGGSSRSASAIVPFLAATFAPRSVVDVGCGVGTWLAEFARRGVPEILGVDGAYVRRDELVIDPGAFIAADVSMPLPLTRRFDLATSFEVAEHLPEACAAQFVAGLTRLAPVVAFSAAIPGQGGTGHVNEQWPSYWSAAFARCGYEAIDLVRPRFWNDAGVEFWYVQNTLVYVARERLAADPALQALRDASPPPHDLVHPRLYAQLEKSEHGVRPALRRAARELTRSFTKSR